ncbi:MFS transporter [Brevibacillus fulvus]|uniref:DHA2 family metal-tetracycline-proton antiporter-like MFS transporter n=1 Tax=Brevibacillus fulvus TaxID=1125967 RepID=A0A938XXK6_9BACL|nr:MFS transporter [Brevibacillus fulvus]MBM7589550.1 DHA2 family metal-tetracycline-proton antiporter-like MFS transporter [Brevibacillus fulvus]
MTEIHKLPIILLVCGTVFLGVLGGAMAIPVLPAIADTYGLLPSEASWMFIAVELFMVIGAVLYAKLANIFPIRNLFLFGMLCFGAGSIFAGLTSHYWLLVVARMLQGLGASAAPPLAMILVTRHFPEQDRGKIMALIGPVIGIASQLGPFVGGLIAQQFGWKTVFWITVLILLLTPLCIYLPKEQKQVKEPFDFRGASLFLAAIVTFILGVNLYIYLLAAALLLSALFWLHSRRCRTPFLQLELLANLRFLSLSLGGALTIFTLNATMLAAPLFLAKINHLDSGMIGLILLPGALLSLIGAAVVGKLTEKLGYYRIAIYATCLLMIGYSLLSTLLGTSPLAIALCLIVVYLGFTNAQGMFPNLIPRTVSAEQLNTGLGIYNLIFFFGATAGPTFMGSFLELETEVTWNVFNKTSPAVYSNSFVIMALMSCLILVLLWLQRQSEKTAEHPEHVT